MVQMNVIVAQIGARSNSQPIESAHLHYNPRAMTAAPAATTTTKRPLCSLVPAPIVSDGSVLSVGVAALAMLVPDVLAALLDGFADRTIVDVAVA